MIWHSIPEYPISQEQPYALTLSWHVPPFLQGLLATLGLNEQEVYKNVSGVLLSVPKDFLKFPLNAPTQKIIGWEIFVQSQSKHFIPVQKQVSKRRSNMHKIKKIRSLCFVNFWRNLRKCSHFFILSLNKSCEVQFNWDSIFNISSSHSLADFSFSHLKKNPQK